MHLRKRKLVRAGMALAWGVGLGLVSTGCGNSITCALQGDNLRGHVLFAEGVTIEPTAAIVVQVSTDSFATAGTTKFSVVNTNALVSVPYEACVDNDTTYQLRAFQDLDQDGVLEAGEAIGLYDDTDTGNAAYQSVTIPSSVDQSTWTIEKDINLTLDGEQT